MHSLLAPTLFLPLCSPPVPSLSFLPLFFFLPTMSYDHTDEQTSINIKPKHETSNQTENITISRRKMGGKNDGGTNEKKKTDS